MECEKRYPNLYIYYALLFTQLLQGSMVLGNASVRPFLYFDRSTLTSLLRPFVKSGLLIGREVQVEIRF